MPSQIMNIGPAPHHEDCAQLGQPDYDSLSSKECAAYKGMLARLFPVPENGKARLVTKAFEHDFGTYREVCVVYDDNDREATEYAYHVERHSPAYWDDTARAELSLPAQPLH